MINIKNKKLVIAIGTRIREDLANEADIPLSQIGRIERGENNPTISTLYVIAAALNVELKTLVDFKL